MDTNTIKDRKEQCRSTIIGIYLNEKRYPELIRLLHFLDVEDEQYCLPNECSPFWRTLLSVTKTGSAQLLAVYLADIVKVTYQCERNLKFLNAMKNMHKILAEEATKTEGKQIGHAKITSCFGKGLLQFWEPATAKEKTEILGAIDEMGKNYGAIVKVERDVQIRSSFNKACQNVRLAAVALTKESWQTMWKWWHGEISGKRCAKIHVENFLSLTTGFGCGVAIAASSLLICPGLAIPVGLVGGAVSCVTAKMLLGSTMDSIFDLPRSEALEKAYNFLEVHHNDENNLINSAYRKLAIKYHPDKCGDTQKFYKLQLHMATIKLARNDY